MTKTLDAAVALFQGAAQLAAETLERNADRSTPVVHHLEPEELTRALELELPREGRGLEQALELARRTLHFSVATGHPRFMNQLFGGMEPAAVLGEWIAALTNTSMYTFEAAPVGTVVELALLGRLASIAGLEESEGVFAPGGSIANLMAAIVARHARFPHVKQHGLRPGDRPVMFCSEESHYSIRRAAMVLGLGTDGCVEVPVDRIGRMDPDALAERISATRAEGRTPFFVCATVGTTVPGAFDPLHELADLAGREGLWLHADASYGGSVLMSRRHRHLADGIERADSITWNPHKMMGVPLACAALLTRHRGLLAGAMGMNADYLFHEDSEPERDLGDRSLQCGRRVDALKLWFAWQATGDEGYEQRIDHLFGTAERFRELVRAREGFRLIREQQGTNVCFRYLPAHERHLEGTERDHREHAATLGAREAMAREGSFLVNYATLDGAATFRLVASNTETTEEDLVALLDRIEAHAR
jgi:sulfinoalanine decarboxylase